MIYIKDYSSINKQLINNQASDLSRELNLLMGKAVTIFTNSGSASKSGFKGILIDVRQGSVVLLQNPGPPPIDCPRRKRREFDNTFGTKAVIALDHICAVLYNYI